MQQLVGALCDRIDRLFERRLIALRGLVGSAQLAHELQCGVMDLRVRRRRIEIEERLDISAHDLLPVVSPPIQEDDCFP